MRAAVTLSQRYLSDRFLPDKAVNLLDEAGSRVRLLQLKGRAQHLDLVHLPPPYCDQKVANREMRVWHFVIKIGY